MRKYKLPCLLAVALTAIAVAACYEDVCGCTPSLPPSFVSIDVRDQNGLGVPNAAALIGAAGRVVGDSQGRIFFAIAPGNNAVRIELPSPYFIAPDQVNPVGVTVEYGDTAHILFRAIKPAS
jgi:hypothetical protein